MTPKQYRVVALEVWGVEEVFIAEDKDEALLRMEDALYQGRFQDSDFTRHSDIGTELWIVEEI
jgi:hypothetical protein